MTLLEVKTGIKKLFLRVLKLEAKTTPMVVEESPITLGLVPEYIGQIVMQPNATKVWIAYNATSWTYIIID